MHAHFILQNVFREVFDDPGLVLRPETGRDDIEGWDSVAQVKLVLAVEEEFGFQFDENEVSSIGTAGGFLNCIESRRPKAA
jgi:acyl carrier protein